ncbi:hypothetical protein ACI68E_000365 [Malassezia pachydermatis]
MCSGGMTPMGLVTVSTLAHQGAHIIMLVPDLQADDVIQMVLLLRESTMSENIFAEKCDICDLNSITDFAKRWHAGTLVTGKDGVPTSQPPSSTPSSSKAPPSTTLPGLPSQQAHRVDTILFLPSTGAVGAFGASHDDVYDVDVLARFHFVNAMLPSLLILPPNRDVRIISAVSPWYAAGLGQFERVSIPLTKPFFEPWTRLGAASLHWIVLAAELQRRLDLLAEADTRSRTRLPDLEGDEDQVPQHGLRARRSHISSIVVCPGFEVSSQLLSFFQTYGAGRMHKYILWMLWLLLAPWCWIIGKPTSRAAEAMVWGATARLETESRTLRRKHAQQMKTPSVLDDDALARQWPGLQPGFLYREGLLIAPPVPSSYQGTGAAALWRATEERVQKKLQATKA